MKSHGSGSDIRVSVRFRPSREDGLIFGLMTTKDPESNRIALYVREGKKVTNEVFLLYGPISTGRNLLNN